MSLFSRLMAERDKHWLQIIQDERLAQTEARQPDGCFHASAIVSDAGQTCDRFLAYCLYAPRVDKYLDPKLARIFRVGEDLHLSLQKIYHECGVLVLNDNPDVGREYEHPFHYVYPPIRGNADGVIKKPYSEELYVLELKSMNSNMFTHITGPKPAHIKQINIYEGGLGIYKGIFVYENKDNQEQKYFEQEFDPEEWGALMLRLQHIYDMYTARRLPPKLDIPACNSCIWKNGICKGRNASGEYITDDELRTPLRS